jgi:hypothetical protein
MNSKAKFIIALAAVLVFSMASCTGSGGGGKSFNSAEELKAYLDKQPANSPDKPIRVTMSANAPMLPNIVIAINSAGKYVSLNLSGSALTTIPEYAFFDRSTRNGMACTLLTAITIPDSVASIEEAAFSGCTGLASVTIGTGVSSIGAGAFYQCTSLVSVTIPDNITSIGRMAFNGCTSLASVTIGNGVTEIEDRTFSGCTSLASVTIGNSVTDIDYAAFGDCTSLASVTIPDSVTYLGGFEGCTSLTIVSIPNNVTSIGNFAFNGCTNLSSVIIPNSVTAIGYEAFNGCTSLASVTFQGAITSDKFNSNRPFPSDLRTKYLARGGGIGTYTRPSGGNTWTKQ